MKYTFLALVALPIALGACKKEQPPEPAAKPAEKKDMQVRFPAVSQTDDRVSVTVRVDNISDKPLDLQSVAVNMFKDGQKVCDAKGSLENKRVGAGQRHSVTLLFTHCEWSKHSGNAELRGAVTYELMSKEVKNHKFNNIEKDIENKGNTTGVSR
jgi:hypothetical protein